jgi:hypothetical protein
MSSYLFSFSWGIVILFSLIGWGGVINRILFPKYRIDWGQKAAWGIAFSVFIGGILNVVWIISRATILVYLGAGLLYWLFDIFRTKRSDIGSLFNHIDNYRKDKIVVVGILVVFSLLLLQYGGWISTKAYDGVDRRDLFHSFNLHDDFHSYCVFPEKMIQTGSLGPDPFCETRLISSLGGHYFLHTFILSMLSVKNLNIIDPGLGIIIAVGLLLGYFKNKGTPKRAAVFLLLFFLLTPLPKANISALMIPVALFLSFFRTLDWEGLRTSGFIVNAFIIALIAAAICSLKSNLIPACGILFALNYFIYIIESKIKKKAVYEFFIATILVGVFLLPWMISMYQSSGTLLYPIFGKGYHGSVYGTFLVGWSGLTFSKGIRTLLYYLGEPYVVSLMLLSFISFISRPAKFVRRRASLSISISAILGTIIMLIMTRLPSPRHYFAFLFSAIIILMMLALSNIEEKDISKFKNFTAVFTSVLIAGIIIGSNWSSLRWLSYPRFKSWQCIPSIKNGIANAPLFSDEVVFRHTGMQQSIPQGETVLARLAYPFLLDFKRNRIFIPNWPGGASLPPGMPSFKGAEALANYLISKSIRYVAYSYANEANCSWKLYGKRIYHGNNQIRTTARHAFDFQNNLKQLGETRKRIYDDGYIFVLDLLNRRGQK